MFIASLAQLLEYSESFSMSPSIFDYCCELSEEEKLSHEKFRVFVKIFLLLFWYCDIYRKEEIDAHWKISKTRERKTFRGLNEAFKIN